MKAFLAGVVVLGAASACLPAWAGEGAGDPFPLNTPPLTTQMTMVPGGNTDPFKWSSAPAASQMTVKRGGNTDPFQWASSPVPPAAARHATGTPAQRNPG